MYLYLLPPLHLSVLRQAERAACPHCQCDSLICTPPKPIRAGSTGSTLFVTVNQLWGSGNNIFKKTRKKTVTLSFKIWISSMFLHVSWHRNAFVLCLLEPFYQFSRTASLVKYSISMLLHILLVTAIANNKTKTTVTVKVKVKMLPAVTLVL